MTLAGGSQDQDQDEQQTLSWIRRLALLLFVLAGSFGCTLLAAQVALSRLEPKPLRDVRSAVRPNYLAEARRAAPLVPQVIEAVKQDVEIARATPDFRALTVVPVVQIPRATATLVGQITPTPTPSSLAVSTPGVEDTPPPTATPRPTDTRPPTDTPTAPPAPTDTPTIVPATASPTQLPTATSMPTQMPTLTATPIPPTASPAPTATPPLPSATATPIPTSPPPTFTSTAPPAPTDTYTPAPTQPPAPTDTPVPTNTPIPPDTPTPTDTPTASPVPPPDVLSINPNAIVQGSGSDPDISIDIVGQNFVGSTAWLGQNIGINIVSVADTLINGTLSPNIPTGIFALTVQNLDGQRDVLSRAFTVNPRPRALNTLDSDVAFLSSFGPLADATEGDDDHVQIIFFEVPDGPNDVLYIRIFDPDIGGAYDKPGVNDPFGDTTMAYALRGGSGAYTEPDARSDHPGSTGIGSGALIAETIIGEDPLLDGTWLSFPVNRNAGELVGGSYLFKLVVQGITGDDGNRFQAAISTDPSDNLPVAGARIFAFSWCVALPNPGDAVNVYPFVPGGSSQITQFNLDYDVSPGSEITLITPLRNLPVVSMSGNGDVASQDFIPFTGETDATWTAQYMAGSAPPSANDFTLWFRGDGAAALAVFTAPTLVSPR